MAYRLKQRYGHQLVYWLYDVRTYPLSNPVKTIPERRLKQFSTVHDTELKPLIQEIIKSKKSGYQESVLAEIVEDIRRLNEG